MVILREGVCRVKVLLIGPGGLSALPMVADGSEAGHCFHLLFSSSSFSWDPIFMLQHNKTSTPSLSDFSESIYTEAIW